MSSICKKCKKDFVPSKGLVNYCSLSCRNSNPKSKEVRLKISNLLKNSDKVKLFNKKRKGKDLDKVCLFCGNNYITRRKSQKFCCRKCADKGTEKGGWKHIVDLNLNWSEINKKSYSDGNNYVAGGTTRWYRYKEIKVQGTYELRVCIILDLLKKNNDIERWEYTKDRFNYIGVDGDTHSYLVDFKVYNKDNTFYYIEVKGWEKPNDKLKWRAVRDKGYILNVWFNEDIKSVEKKLNIKR